MATTFTFSGSLNIASISGEVDFGGDKSGQQTVTDKLTVAFTASGSGTPPTITGFFSGNAAVTGSADIQLAHLNDPLQTFGDASYSDGFTVAGSKLKCLALRNKDTANSVTVTRKTGAGLPILSVDGNAFPLAVAGFYLWYSQNGTAALTNASNDTLTLAPSAGTPNVQVTALYGD